MEMQLFSDRKYIFSSSSRQHELRPSEYEHNDTKNNESQFNNKKKRTYQIYTSVIVNTVGQ